MMKSFIRRSVVLALYILTVVAGEPAPDTEDLPEGYLPAVRVRFHPPPSGKKHDKLSFKRESLLNKLGAGLRDGVAALTPMVDLPEKDMTSFSKALTQAPDLRLWQLITPADGVSVTSLLQAAQEDPAVDVAELAPAPVEPPEGTGLLAMLRYRRQNEGKELAPDYQDDQGYLSPAPEGIDADYAWRRWGGTGRCITVYDVEYSWNPNHEDEPNVDPKDCLLPAGASIYDPWDSTDHGTAVMSEVVGEHNRHGIKGISYNSRYKFSPEYIIDSGGVYQFSVGAGIARAAADGKAGDVILIEAQSRVCGTDRYGPVEWDQFEFDAIRAAVDKGIVVVEAAGNGNVNLDQSSCLGRFNRNVRDSGAIIVGAGAASSSTTPRERLWYSTYGDRVDVQGWGEMIYAAGYGDEFRDPDDPDDENRWYTNSFGGTSGASPIVTGAVASLQGIAKFRRFGRPLSPDDIRDLLVSTGTAQQFGRSGNIGPLPDLKAAIQAL